MLKNEVIISRDNQKFSIGSIIFTTIFTTAFIIQIIMMFMFYNELEITFLAYTGWLIWVFSLYFGLISFRTFKKRGNVEKGKMYVYTNKLVTKGPYAIIRHPQYLGGILFTISITFWTQKLLSLVLSIIIILLTYQWTYSEENNLIKKFGEEYKKYKEKVPRLNPILGIIKYISQKKKE
ncbi:MAG: methyltransferase family protein [Candidatus Thorarchaeota archaeon]